MKRSSDEERMFHPGHNNSNNNAQRGGGGGGASDHHHPHQHPTKLPRIDEAPRGEGPHPHASHAHHPLAPPSHAHHPATATTSTPTTTTTTTATTTAMPPILSPMAAMHMGGMYGLPPATSLAPPQQQQQPPSVGAGGIPSLNPAAAAGHHGAATTATAANVIGPGSSAAAASQQAAATVGSPVMGGGVPPGVRGGGGGVVAPNTQNSKFDSALGFLDQVKMQFHNQPHIYNEFLNVMKDFKAQVIDTPGVIARVSNLFKGYPHLVSGFNTFLPPDFKIEVKEEEPTKQPEFDQARAYVKKIKVRFHSQPEVYKSFLEILHNFHREQHTISDVYKQVAILFADHQDLLDEFRQFLPDNNVPGEAARAVPSGAAAARKTKQPKRATRKQMVQQEKKRKRRSKERQPAKVSRKAVAEDSGTKQLNMFYKIRKRLGDEKLYTEFLKCLNLYSQKIISRLELALLVRDLLGAYPDLYETFKAFVGFSEEEDLELAERESESEEAASWSDIDFSECKRYGPSYRALPKKYFKNKPEDELLNDRYVSVPTGSEDFGFKGSRKNQYEEVLFKCEDDRYELDLVIELNASTLRALEPLLRQINNTAEDKLEQWSKNFRLNPPVDILHLRSIERIYGSRGPDVVTKLFENPVVAIPVILKRLKQKDHEWRNARREWNKIWREVNEKNYHRSLDHQSFYFKQMEKKNLSNKVLLMEIKKRYQEKLKEKVAVSKNTAASTQAGAPEGDAHLKYAMADEEVFSDITALITNAAEKTLSKADREKLDAFLEHFVRQFFSRDYRHEARRTGSTSNNDSTSAYDQSTKVGEEGNTEGSPANAASSNQQPTTTIKDEDGMDVESSPQQQEKGKEKESTAMEGVEAMAEEPSTTTTSEEQSKPATDANGRAQVDRPRPSSKSTKVFYGNDAFYYFFRLYQILYERLTSAKEMAKSSEKERWAASVLTPPKPEAAAGEAENSAKRPKDKYQTLITSIYSLMEGSLDVAKFEDDCRDLFGISSFILFTIDKLILTICKQLQMLISDQTCITLLALYSYEGARKKGSLEPIYHSNVVQALSSSSGGDEKIFRFAFNQPTAEFTIQLLDPALKPRFVDLSFDREKWSKYVDDYLYSETTDVDARQSHVFLLRNKRKGERENVMDNVISRNELECKICLTTFRLFFVEDTGDFFYRKGQLSKARTLFAKERQHLSQRTQRFRKWLPTPPPPAPGEEAFSVSFSSSGSSSSSSSSSSSAQTSSSSSSSLPESGVSSAPLSSSHQP